MRHPGTAASFGPLAPALMLALVCACAAACDGFTADQGGWWCVLDYSAYPLDESGCTVAWTCENMDAIHVGAADDPDPLLRSYGRSVDCSPITSAAGGREYSCACYEEQRHHTTFTDPTICEIYFAHEEGWFKRVVARAKDGCSWPALPR